MKTISIDRQQWQVEGLMQDVIASACYKVLLTYLHERGEDTKKTIHDKALHKDKEAQARRAVKTIFNDFRYFYGIEFSFKEEDNVRQIK